MNEFNYFLQARWGDMDALGHINHAAYFTYFEQARIAWWQAINIELNHSSGPVVIKAEAEYYQTMLAPCEVHIKTNASLPGRSSYWISYELFSSSMLCAKGKTKIVWVDYKKNKSVSLPENMLKNISKN